MTATPTRYNDGFDVGDLLHSSWGYDQTNATFYRVEKRTPHFVTIVKLQKRTVRSADGYSVQGVVPTNKPVLQHVSGCDWEEGRTALDILRDHYYHQKDAETLDCFEKTTSRHKVSGYGSIRIASYANAYPWGGKPEYDTSAAGHMGH